MKSGRAWAALWLVASVPLAAQTPDQSALEKEAALGRRLADEFRHHTTPIDNPEVQQYLDGIGRRLTAANARGTSSIYL